MRSIDSWFHADVRVTHGVIQLGDRSARLVHGHKLRRHVETVSPTVVERVWRGRDAVLRETERAEFALVGVDVSEARLDVAQRNARRRQHAIVILGVLMDDFALALPAQAGHIGHVDGIAAAFVVQIAQDGIKIVAARVGRHIGTRKELVSHRNVESPFAGKIPARIATAFAFGGKTGPVSVVSRPEELVCGAFDDLVLTFRQVNRIQLAQTAPPRFHRERITASRATVTFKQPPPAPLKSGRVRRVEPLPQLLVIRRIAGGEKQLARRPRQLIVVRECVPIMRELLIRPVFAIFRNRIGQKTPSALRPRQVVRRFLGKLLLEQRR